MEDVQRAMNTKDVVALGRALKEAERLNIDEVRYCTMKRSKAVLVCACCCCWFFLYVHELVTL